MSSSPSPRLEAALAPRYALGRPLGRGGMATVYAAEDRKHGREVAIKVLHPELGETLVAERFLREIRIAAGLNHPHILPLFDSGQVDGTLYYVMPLIEGESLRDRLTRQTQLPLDEALAIAGQVAAALEHAHGHGIVHRDIKPENILFSGGEAVVADFGIARAVRAAGEPGLTKTGLALGTPAYMSPEQAGGGHAPDARTDIYALGCVLYEMLVGEPPFTGANPRMVMARHMADRPPSLTVARPDLPDAVEEAVHKALAKSPADRFQTAAAMNRALSRAVEPEPKRAWRPWAVAGSLAVAATALVLVLPQTVFNSELRPDLYVLGPALGDAFEHGSGSPGLWEHYVRSALRQVPGVHMPSDVLVNDRLQRDDAAPDFATLRGVARDLGAGRLITLTATRLPDSTEITAVQHDLSREGRTDLPSARVRVSRGSIAEGPAAATRLVEDLFSLRRGSISPVLSGNELATRAFVGGYDALGRWDLETAERRFQEALDHDPAYPRANFWLAQMRSWGGQPAEAWLDHARRATEGATERAFVDGRERTLAVALRHLGERRYAEACDAYETLVSSDAADFDAWFGLGECRRQDRIVVPDAASPSGWAFRSSYQAALEAYGRAFRLVPGFPFAFGREYQGRLEELLFTRTNKVRVGRPATDTATFASYPALEADTLSFTPWPLADIVAGSERSIPASLEDAVDASRRLLLQWANSWVQEYPSRFEPNHALARALELQGVVESSVNRSALTVARRALAAAETARDSLEAQLVLLRLHLKLTEFSTARHVADELLLRWGDEADSLVARPLSALAALRGRAHVAARLARTSPVVLQPDLMGPIRAPVLETREALGTYAAVGAPVDSIRALLFRLEDQVRRYHSASERERYRCHWVGQMLYLAFPVLGRTVDDGECFVDPHLEMQWAVTNGRSDRARAVFRRLQGLRKDERPGDLPIGGVFQEAWLLVAAGDTLEAVEHLDRSLENLIVLPLDMDVSAQPAETAGLVRAMALRAELAASRGEGRIARRWAEGVVTLWDGSALPEVRETVSRMRAILRA